MRSRRWSELGTTFPDLADFDVLDLGGTAGSWLRAPIRPRSVTLVNLTVDELKVGSDAELPSWIRIVAGDACDPPAEIRSGAWDLVFSNSLIEHVGGPGPRRSMAAVVRELAPRYWIQTPYRFFPVEPHWLFPLFQFLPLRVKAAASRWWPLMHTRSGSHVEAVQTALSVELLSLTELEVLFPDARIHREKIAGMTKSVTAIRTVEG